MSTNRSPKTLLVVAQQHRGDTPQVGGDLVVDQSFGSQGSAGGAANAGWLARLDRQAAAAPKEFPLAAGGRRMFNANQIFRDPAWRRDDPDGAMSINSSDLSELGTQEGDWFVVQSAVGRLVVRCKVDNAMRSGQLALPHGYGQVCPDGERLINGPRIDLLTESGNRDSYRGHDLPQERRGSFSLGIPSGAGVRSPASEATIERHPHFVRSLA